MMQIMRRGRGSTKTIRSGVDIHQYVIEKIDEDETEQQQSPVRRKASSLLV